MSAVRDSLRHRPGRYRPHPVRAGAILIVLLGVVAYSALALRLPFSSPSGQLVTAHVETAANARAGQPVRVRGVEVGHVEDIDAHPSGRGARVTLRLDDEIVVHRDATAAVRWRTMFGGNLYVDLEPGTPSAPPLAGREIPLASTATQVEFDQLLRPLDDDGRRAIQTAFREADIALSAPLDPAGAIDRLEPTMRSIAPALEAMRGTSPGDAGRLVRGLTRAAEGLGASERHLAGLIDSADTTLAVTAARRADLSAFLREAPSTISETRSAMRRMRVTLDELDPLVEDLRPGVRRLRPAAVAARPAARELRSVLGDLRPAFADLEPALEQLRGASLRGVPALRGLKPSLARTHAQIVPLLSQTDSRTGLRTYEALGPLLASMASTAGEFDRDGYMIRYNAAGGEGSLNPTACQFTSSGEQRNACDALLGTLVRLLGSRSR